MNSRLAVILVALTVLVVFALIASNTEFKQVQVSIPLRGEAARNPFYAALRLSEELGAQASWDRVFTAPPADAALLLSQWNWSLSRTRREGIQRWVEAGGRLVIDGSLFGDLEEFERWSGVSTQEREDDDEEEEEEESETESTVEAPEPDDDYYCDDLSENGSTRQIEVCGVDYSRSLQSSRKILWSLRDGDSIHALRTAVGRGTVTVINASPFQYRDFLLGDHPQLFVTLTQLRRGDQLLILTEDDRGSLLALMWRFGAPVVLLLLAGILLALWRAIPRFGPPVASTEAVRRSLAEQIRGTGLFALRFGGGESLHAATIRALRDAAIRRFPTYDRMSSEERVAVLARTCGVSGEDLAPALNYSGRRSSHELRQAIAVLETVRRRLTMKRK